jgi:protein-tyrosine phosphatase
LNTPTISVLFVCLGNICRSPTGEGVFKALVDKEGLSERFLIDSAGTAAFHVGEPPDGRSQTAALRRGIDLSDQRARKVRVDDFRKFDYILAMDAENHTNLLAVCPPGEEKRVRLLLDFAVGVEGESVPDPYFSRGNGFEIVLDLIELATFGLLDDIRANHF